jgi:hypothetical protein
VGLVVAGTKVLTKRVPWCWDFDITMPLRVETRAPLWMVALHCLSMRGGDRRVVQSVARSARRLASYQNLGAGDRSLSDRAKVLVTV